MKIMRSCLVALTLVLVFMLAPRAIWAGGCAEQRPILDLAFSPLTGNDKFQPIYLPTSNEMPGQYPGVRLNLGRTSQRAGLAEFTVGFDFDPELLSADYSIYRVEIGILDGSRVASTQTVDLSESCLRPQGRQIRAGESMDIAKFSVDTARLSYPRVRLQIWGGMF